MHVRVMTPGVYRSHYSVHNLTSRGDATGVITLRVMTRGVYRSHLVVTDDYCVRPKLSRVREMTPTHAGSHHVNVR